MRLTALVSRKRVVALALAFAGGGSFPACRGSSDPVVAQCSPGEWSVRACGICGEQRRDCNGSAFGEWGACVECDGSADAEPSSDGETGADAPLDVAADVLPDAASDVSEAADGSTDNDAAADAPGDVAAEDAGLPDAAPCSALASGPPGVVTLPTGVTKLVPDPARCRVYGMSSNSATLVAIDVATKAIAGTLSLGAAPSDMDLSPNGAHLVVAQDSANQVLVLDPSTFTITKTIPTSADPDRIEVSNAGIAYYATMSQWSSLYRVDLGAWPVSEALLSGVGFVFEPDLELSPTGSILYAAESNSTAPSLFAFDVGANPAQVVDSSKWSAPLAFYDRQTYLGPGGQHVYFGGARLDATNLKFLVGMVGEKVFAEDIPGTFAVGETAIYDAELIVKVASLPQKAGAAALAAEDKELWFASPGEAKAHYLDVADLLGNVKLGQRKHAASSLASYTFAKLIADPVRPRLYALAPDAQSVVSIDATTLAPIDAIVVGSVPSDLEIDPTGSRIYVGHLGTQGVAVIDATTFDFVGFLPTTRVAYDVAPVASGQLVVIDQDQWTTPTLIDAVSGQELLTLPSVYEGALATTADGASLFIGEGGVGGHIERYSVAAGQLVESGPTTASYASSATQGVVAVPDGSGVYFEGGFLDGNDLTVVLYPQTDQIRAVTADGVKATSANAVYRVFDGAMLGALPAPGAIQAAAPSGETVYVWTGSAVTAVDLSGY